MATHRDSILSSFRRTRPEPESVEIRRRNTLADLNAKSAAAQRQLEMLAVKRERDAVNLDDIEQEMRALRVSMSAVTRT